MSRELEVLRSSLAQLESALGPAPALPRVQELERRVQALETIVTGADDLLEERLREAARKAAGRAPSESGGPGGRSGT